MEGIEPWILAPLTRALEWTREKLLVFLTQVRKKARNRSIHAYLPMSIQPNRSRTTKTASLFCIPAQAASGKARTSSESVSQSIIPTQPHPQTETFHSCRALLSLDTQVARSQAKVRSGSTKGRTRTPSISDQPTTTIKQAVGFRSLRRHFDSCILIIIALLSNLPSFFSESSTPATMTSKGVSLLKFVGTVSLGLLTGLSYSLSTVTVPSILSLPSASDALRAFQNLYPSANTRLRILTGVSTASFLFAFFLSPRAFRHPYLVYASVLCLASGAAEQITPYVLSSPESSSEAIAARRQARREREDARKAARIARQEARMEASYEVLGDTHSDAASDGEAAAAAAFAEEEENFNGEEIRVVVDGFRKTQIVQTAIASVGFLMSVIGIWGDGAIQVFQTETVIVGV
ncbi:hypothetical protein CKAH01_03200 [Colletotrichum kahawae]|uniref:Autophagy-related protein 33 n=1 Tax=Colletotrichum kahawae TaxID=34407 RepID=A0AAE0DBX1_COLKA|nr:hypothetical protein CKAH01_03200 [Colletotrichum kahawae]